MAMFPSRRMLAAAYGRVRLEALSLRDRFGFGPAAEYKYTRDVEAAALAGDIVAQARLGTAYHEGLGVKQNPEKALFWFAKAAHGGHSGAASALAVAYEVGAHVEPNLVMAAFYAHFSKRGGNEIGAMFYPIIHAKLDDDQKRELEALIENSIRPAKEAG